MSYQQQTDDGQDKKTTASTFALSLCNFVISSALSVAMAIWAYYIALERRFTNQANCPASYVQDLILALAIIATVSIVLGLVGILLDCICSLCTDKKSRAVSGIFDGLRGALGIASLVILIIVAVNFQGCNQVNQAFYDRVLPFVIVNFVFIGIGLFCCLCSICVLCCALCGAATLFGVAAAT